MYRKMLKQLGILFLTLLFIFNFSSSIFFSSIGFCILLYIVFYLICINVFDCDVKLVFTEKFGKSIDCLKGKVVFITGASSGIGEQIAIILAKNGVKLVLASRRKEELERVKSICLESSKGQLTDKDILVLPINLLNYDLHQKYFEDALNYFGQIDIFFSNAGRSQRANWEKINLEVDRAIFDINVFTGVSLSRIALKYFQERKTGHIVVSSSFAGYLGLPYSASYVASKHAVQGYFKSLQVEQSDIFVTILCPGPVYTNFLSECFTETIDMKFGQKANPNDKRMNAERCGYLCAVGIANKLEECWMGLWPSIPILYMHTYWPNLYKLLIKIIGPKGIHKIRDNKSELDLSSLKKSTEE